MRIKISYLLLFTFIFSALVTGCEQVNNSSEIESGVENNVVEQQELEEEELLVLGFQFESQLRSSYRSAYQTWLNLERMTGDTVKNLSRVEIILHFNLENFVYEEIIEEQKEKLRNIAQGGEGEVTFPTHEVVNEAALISFDRDRAELRYNTTRFYPPTEWEGEAYSREYSYKITVVYVNGERWILQNIEYQSDY